MKFLRSQFGHPQGLFGHLVGIIMAYENRKRNLWAVSLLDIQPNDHLLEIGFGPGFAIQQAATRATAGFVAGVDQSAVMVQQARKRNAAAIWTGRVELQLGSATALPYSAAAFDKVFAVNALHHCTNAAQALKEMGRVLKPEGLVAIIEQPRMAASEAQVQALAQAWAAQLVAAGFSQIKRVFKPMRPAASVGVLGVK
jgi:ubiquinone/menaquinone biosynthesis C-methylase UbiE